MDMDNKDNFLEREDIANVVNILSNMFGLVMDRNAIFAIVESCDGDLDDSIEAITHIVDDCYNQDTVNTEPEQSLLPNIETVTQQNTTNFLYPTSINSKSSSPSLAHSNMSDLQQDMAATSQSSTHPDQIDTNPGQQQPNSYARAFKSTGTVPKVRKEPTTSSKKNNDPFWTDQIRRILDYHNKGYRTLIIMRGVSGSGKTWLARKIIEMLVGPTEENYQYHICSSDSFFWRNGRYYYDRNRLSDAHSWNQQRVIALLNQGVSPVIVDNTNTELWEMQPYMVNGIREGYYVEIVEPQNPWSKKPYLLSKKNTHNVSIDKIKMQLNRYEPHYSVENCMKVFNIAYPPNKTPPTFRNFPIFDAKALIDVNKPHQPVVVEKPQETSEGASVSFNDDQRTHCTDEYIVKKLQELEKVAEQWESNEKWEESTENIERPQEANAISSPRPSRNEERLLPDINQVEDWNAFDRIMLVWDNQLPSTPSKQPKKSIASKSFGTTIDYGDTDLNYAQTKYKVLSGKCRDINLNYIPQKEKIPDQRMLDKSTTTNEQIITEPYRCKNEEKHFDAFRKMFKNTPRADLRDIFDKCCGDVNWAVEIVLDGVANNQILVLENENVSDTDDTNNEQCECAAAYEIIPNVITKSPNINAQPEPKPQPSSPAHPRAQIKKKIKKESTVSNTTMQLKKQLEQNVAISDKHYSEHCLKIRKLRRGEIGDLGTQTDGASTSEQDKITESDNNSDSESSGNQEALTETVNINLGTEFMVQLDSMFGRSDVTYPENIVTMVNMPMSTLNEINALWVESLSYQLECQKSLSNILIKQDKELAMALAETEAEQERQGVEPEVPDFKEIMDLDFALSLHHRDVNGEWRAKEPNDMAAKMTRIKLQNLFPDIQHEVLSELLMAHDNNFQTTVEVLLMSTGQGGILKKKNGINKFVMEKEIARQEQILKEKQNTNLSEEEWPVLTQIEDITMETVNQYRHDAQMHLERRNLNYNKARDSMNRGMVMIASYYTEVAAFHKKKFEEANSLAASSLIQLNAKNRSTTTLDLHYLYVAEAIPTLDMFIDYHIDLLKEESKKGQHKNNSLFLITGRGLHSRGGPRVKPAVKRRLKERGLTEITQLNPGLITVRITPYDKLTSELNET